MDFSQLNFTQILSSFLVLLGIIDIIGAVPIIIPLKEKGRDVSPVKATLISFGLLLGFFYGGNWILALFGCDIQSFAVAGAILIFLTALEMILDIEIFKNIGPTKEATLISLKAMYADINIMIALVLNMVWVFIVLNLTDFIKNLLGASGIYFIRKFFGIILLAISVKLFSDNVVKLFH